MLLTPHRHQPPYHGYLAIIYCIKVRCLIRQALLPARIGFRFARWGLGADDNAIPVATGTPTYSLFFLAFLISGIHSAVFFNKRIGRLHALKAFGGVIDLLLR